MGAKTIPVLSRDESGDEDVAFDLLIDDDDDGYKKKTLPEVHHSLLVPSI